MVKVVGNIYFGIHDTQYWFCRWNGNPDSKPEYICDVASVTDLVETIQRFLLVDRISDRCCFQRYSAATFSN
jgi:hypothetical protein